MNGRPTTQPPASVQRARQQQGRQGWTGLWGSRILGALVVLAVLAIAGTKYVLSTQPKDTKKTQVESTLEPTEGRQPFHYKVAEPIKTSEPIQPIDTTGQQLADMRSTIQALRNEVDTLKHRKQTATVANQSNTKTAPIVKRSATPTLFVSHDLGKETSASAHKKQGEYLLAPGTFLPCEIETEINSEVPGFFTAKLVQNVYDTATGHHLLAPQGSKILGHDNSGKLLYGNERMDTVSLKLILPDGRSVDLGNAPITDQEGVAGLTGDVDQHYGRLLGAVFIGGALKGGMQAMQTGMMQAAGAGQVASGIATYGSQASSQLVGPALDTRPTIKVHAGQLCTVLLVKELRLAEMWR